MASREFNIIELRMIEQMCTTRTIQYIASMLDRDIEKVRIAAADIAKRQNIELFKPVVFERKLKKIQNEQNWAKELLQDKPMKVRNTEKMIYVRIDHKTHVMVPEGSDIEAIKQKYSKRHNYGT